MPPDADLLTVRDKERLLRKQVSRGVKVGKEGNE